MATPSSAGSGRSSLTSNRGCIESDLHLLPVSCSVKMIYGQKKRGQTRKVLVGKKKKKKFSGRKISTLCRLWGRNHHLCNTGHVIRAFYFFQFAAVAVINLLHWFHFVSQFLFILSFFVIKQRLLRQKTMKWACLLAGERVGHTQQGCLSCRLALSHRDPAGRNLLRQCWIAAPDRPTPPTGGLTKCANSAPRPRSRLGGQFS